MEFIKKRQHTIAKNNTKPECNVFGNKLVPKGLGFPWGLVLSFKKVNSTSPIFQYSEIID